MAAASSSSMRLTSRLFACVAGGVIAFLAFSWWHDWRVATICAARGRDPCRVPGDFFVLVAPIVTLLGALLGAVTPTIMHWWTQRGAAR